MVCRTAINADKTYSWLGIAAIKTRKVNTFSLEGKIAYVGTKKRFYKIYIYKIIPSITNDQYLVAFDSDLNHLKAMSIDKKQVQEVIGDISSLSTE